MSGDLHLLKKFKQIYNRFSYVTGVIIVCLGSEYAGLFSNDDKLSSRSLMLVRGERKFECLYIKIMIN